MKTRKALAVLLAVVMLVVPLAASSYAAPAASPDRPAPMRRGGCAGHARPRGDDYP